MEESMSVAHFVCMICIKTWKLKQLDAVSSTLQFIYQNVFCQYFQLLLNSVA